MKQTLCCCHYRICIHGGLFQDSAHGGGQMSIFKILGSNLVLKEWSSPSIPRQTGGGGRFGVGGGQSPHLPSLK